MWRVKLPNLMTILTASATGGSITEGSLLVQCVVIRTASAEVAALFAVLPGDRAGGNTEGTPSSEAAGGDGWQQDVIVRGQISVFGSSAAAEALLDRCRETWARCSPHLCKDNMRIWRRRQAVSASHECTHGRALLNHDLFILLACLVRDVKTGNVVLFHFGLKGEIRREQFWSYYQPHVNNLVCVRGRWNFILFPDKGRFNNRSDCWKKVVATSASHANLL